MDYEDKGMTVVEGDPELPVSREFMRIAEEILRNR